MRMILYNHTISKLRSILIAMQSEVIHQNHGMFLIPVSMFLQGLPYRPCSRIDVVCRQNGIKTYIFYAVGYRFITII